MGKKICFVIMPFSDPDRASDNRWTDLYEHIIGPAVEGAGLDYACYRSLNPSGSFMHDITRNLATADVAIAVLTDLRPNVMYELGARNALKGKTIMLVQEGATIPSDLNAYIALRYSTDTAKGREELTTTIRDRLRTLDMAAPDSDNPIYDNLVLFVTRFLKDWYDTENPRAFRDRLRALLPDFVLMLEHVWREIGTVAKPMPSRRDAEKVSPIHSSEREAARQTSVIWTNRGMELKDQHELEGALKCFDAALELNRDNVTAIANRSLVLVMLNRPAEARKSVERIIGSRPGRTPTDWNAAGKALLARKEFREAADAFVHAVSLDGSSAIYANNAGFAFELAGEPARAEEFYREALKLNPRFPHALYNLGKLLRDQNRRDESEVFIAQALQTDHLIGEEVESQRAVLTTRSTGDQPHDPLSS